MVKATYIVIGRFQKINIPDRWIGRFLVLLSDFLFSIKELYS